MISGVYEIKNEINGHCYIGSSVNLIRRLYSHEHGLQNCYHQNKHLQSAYNKYGEKNFTFRILFYCDKENTLLYEQICLDAFHPIYNMSQRATGGSGPVSDEVKQRISKALTGVKKAPFSDLHRQHIADAVRGKKRKPFSAEYRLHLSESGKGKHSIPHTELQKQRISASNIGKHSMSRGPMSEECKRKISAGNVGKHNLGRKQTEESKQKISLGLMGNHNTCGHVLSDEHKKKISGALKAAYLLTSNVKMRQSSWNRPTQKRQDMKWR
jgi:group I intron endonuclease